MILKYCIYSNYIRCDSLDVIHDMRYEQERSAELVPIKIATDFDTKKKDLTLRWA